MKDIPDILETIYKNVSGTRYELKDQRMMDFLPGFLLIHILEYQESDIQLNKILKGREEDQYLPLLRNYSSDFIALNVRTNGIYQIFHDDDESYLIYKNPMDFLKTINDFYYGNAYFMDEDGYLDYDPDLEYEIAKRNNPEVKFWEED